MTLSTAVHSTYPHGWDGPKGNLFKEDDDLNYDQDALNRTASKDPSSTKKLKESAHNDVQSFSEGAIAFLY